MMFTTGARSLAAGLVATFLTLSPEQVATATEAVDTVVTGSIGPSAGASQKRVSATFRKALDLLDANKHAEAYELARGITDSIERRSIQWAAIYYGGGKVPADSVARFIADAPAFTSSNVFRTRLEQALTKTAAPSSDVIKELGGRTPNTVDGQIALAAAYLDTNQKEQATKLARFVWTNNFLDEKTEKRVLDKLGSLLNREAHWTRAVHLMMNDRASAVERLYRYMTPAQKSLAVARNAVSRNAKDAKALLDKVDPSMTGHPVYAFSRAQRARQFELWDDAIAWFDKSKGGTQLKDANKFWSERQGLVRQLLSRGEVRRAYTAAANYTEGPEGRLVEARFHAGWIALSFLNDAKAALPHFEKMAKLSTLPDSVTQANFWLGKTRAKLGDKKGATAAYTAAAQFGTVYYGQLARHELGVPAVEIRSLPSYRQSEPKFESRELVRAIRVLADNGHGALAVPLLSSFAYDLQDGGELLLAARLAQSLDAHHLAIAIADTADRRGIPLDLFNFPKDGLPSTQMASMDKAAVYAVARQESRFKLDAVSSAGARGLMQLMPATAKETAGKIGLAYSASRLTTDGAYNTLLGSTYLKAQLETFQGSLLLAAAAYNAGAGNARKWIGTFGDPRSETIDPVVWVELIPVAETRKYVQRVLGNYLVYRARLGLPPLSIHTALRKLPG